MRSGSQPGRYLVPGVTAADDPVAHQQHPHRRKRKPNDSMIEELNPVVPSQNRGIPVSIVFLHDWISKLGLLDSVILKGTSRGRTKRYQEMTAACVGQQILTCLVHFSCQPPDSSSQISFDDRRLGLCQTQLRTFPMEKSLH